MTTLAALSSVTISLGGDIGSGIPQLPIEYNPGTNKLIVFDNSPAQMFQSVNPITGVRTDVGNPNFLTSVTALGGGGHSRGILFGITDTYVGFIDPTTGTLPSPTGFEVFDYWTILANETDQSFVGWNHNSDQLASAGPCNSATSFTGNDDDEVQVYDLPTNDQNGAEVIPASESTPKVPLASLGYIYAGALGGGCWWNSSWLVALKTTTANAPKAGTILRLSADFTTVLATYTVAGVSESFFDITTDGTKFYATTVNTSSTMKVYTLTFFDAAQHSAMGFF